MKILFLGAGAVGGYFGGRLAEAGADVEFLVRDARAAGLRRDGLILRSPLGDGHVAARTVTRAALGPRYDLIVVACKATGLTEAIDALRPAVGGQTVIVPLLNGIAHLAALDDAFGQQRVAGGTCHLSATLGAAGEIVHLNRLHRVAFGERHAAQGAPLAALRESFARTAVDARHERDIVAAMWEKFVFVAALAALTSLMRASMGVVLQTEHGRALADEMLATCRETAQRAGFAPDATRLAAMSEAMLCAGSSLKASMLRDIERGDATEAEHLVGHMSRLAGQHGVDGKLLRVALSHLQSYEIQRQRA